MDGLAHEGIPGHDSDRGRELFQNRAAAARWSRRSTEVSQESTLGDDDLHLAADMHDEWIAGYRPLPHRGIHGATHRPRDTGDHAAIVNGE